MAGRVGRLLLCGCLAAFAGGAAHGEATGPQASPASRGTNTVRTDRYGDPLPDGAVARLGTVRWSGRLLGVAADGRQVAVWASDGVAFLDAASGLEVRRLRFPMAQTCGAVLSPDGRRLAVKVYDKTLIHDVRTGKLLSRIPRQLGVGSLALSPDARTLATREDHGVIVRLWDVATGRQLRLVGGQVKDEPLLRPPDACGDLLAFSPDGSRLAVGCEDGRVQLLDPRTGKTLWQTREPSRELTSLAISADGRTLGWVGRGTLRLWDVTRGAERRVIRLNPSSDHCLAFSPDGVLLAWGEKQGQGIIHLYDLKAGRELRHTPSQPAPVCRVLFSSDGKTLFAALEAAVHRWDVQTGREKPVVARHNGWLYHVAFSPDGRRMASSAGDGTVRVWDRDGRPLGCWAAEVEVSALAFSYDGGTLAVADGERVVLWALAGRQPPRALTFPGVKWVVALTFPGTLRAIAAVGKENQPVLYLIDARDGRVVRRVQFRSPGRHYNLHTAAFSQDGSRLALIWHYGSEPRELYLYDAADGDLVWSFACGRRIANVAFAPDGRSLAISLGGPWNDPAHVGVTALCLLETATGKERARFTAPRDFVSWLAFARGRLIASPLFSDEVGVWDAADGRLLRRWRTTQGMTWTPVVAPDGRRLATLGEDTTVLLWELDACVGQAARPAAGPTAREAERLWQALADPDAARAYRVMCRLSAVPAEAIPFLAARVHAAPDVDLRRVAQLLRDLDATRFSVRERASAELRTLGDAVRGALEQELAKKPELEVRRRVEAILNGMRLWSGEELRTLRVIEVLEQVGSLAARRVLERLARGPAGARLTREAKAALGRLEKRPAAEPAAKP